MSAIRESRAHRGLSLRVRRILLTVSLMLASTAVIARAAQLQIGEHEEWLAAAEGQHQERAELPARRGSIFDRHGVPLAMSHEMFQVSVAPNELRSPESARKVIAEGLGIEEEVAAAATDTERRWYVVPGRFTADQRRKVGPLRGVYFERQLERFYPQGDAGREVIGAVTRDGRALGGIEQQMDGYLRGEAGYSMLRRDARGGTRSSRSLPVDLPKDGSTVYLTIDFDLQEIADAALRRAVDETKSSGGDLILLDPQTGDILAAVSHREGRARNVTAITEPYEPGSTLKPFVAASLLAEQTATLQDSVFAENGSWRYGRRVFTDTSPHQWLTLRDALRVSSNIALVKFAQRLSPGQQYSYLRDFGFGTATGIDYPAESAGRLRNPHEWSALSSGSLAMGYELSVTPLQMALAYGALANGGKLMAPSIISEIRAADGRNLYRRSPLVVREVVDEGITHAITEVLVSVVEDGTATRASLASFAVAGKTGTSRRAGGGTYAPGSYISTFAGYFPADDPQVVIFVKLDDPEGAYYGGLTAAPVTRETLQAILAASSPGIIGRTMLSRITIPDVPMLATAAESPAARSGSAGTYVLSIDALDGVPAGDREARSIEVPDVAGLTMRNAAQRLHAAGLRVRLEGSGDVERTEPVAGRSMVAGTAVTLIGSDS